MKRDFKKISHYFLPHSTTHQKAHFLSWHFLLIYVLLFILLRTGIDLMSVYKPGVLGIDSSISVESVVAETNKERQKLGFQPLKINESLSAAARAKAQNMFEENYWAHYSPSGKDPWGFIKSAGYRFMYAGENLARNFYTSEDVVKAWMDSPTHRENLLNSRYQDIGIGVAEGVLQGQKTTLIVQMFGTSYAPVASAPPPSPTVDSVSKTVSVENVEEKAALRPVVVAGAKNSLSAAALDPFALTRYMGFAMIFFISSLLILDFIVLKRRGVFRFSSHHVAHLGLLAITGTSLFVAKVGEVL